MMKRHTAIAALLVFAVSLSPVMLQAQTTAPANPATSGSAKGASSSTATAPSPTSAPAVVRPGENLVVENVPPIPVEWRRK
ncbi:MAG: hypothetical protein ACJ72H_12425 [Candidatus Sulfotelmatobacter sp.]